MNRFSNGNDGCILDRSRTYYLTNEQLRAGYLNTPTKLSTKDNFFTRRDILRMFRNQFIIVKGATKMSIYDNQDYATIEVLWIGLDEQTAQSVYNSLKGNGQSRCEIFDVETYIRLTGYKVMAA